jgi:predicted aminopeptidase
MMFAQHLAQNEVSSTSLCSNAMFDGSNSDEHITQMPAIRQEQPPFFINLVNACSGTNNRTHNNIRAWRRLHAQSRSAPLARSRCTGALNPQAVPDETSPPDMTSI